MRRKRLEVELGKECDEEHYAWCVRDAPVSLDALLFERTHELLFFRIPSALP